MNRIDVHYTSIDGYYESRSYETVDGARSWAMHWVGEHPEVGQTYAVSGDGVGKITVYGCTIRELFPDNAQYIFTLHTLDSHDHFGPFGSYKAAWTWGYDNKHTFVIHAQRIDQ